MENYDNKYAKDFDKLYKELWNSKRDQLPYESPEFINGFPNAAIDHFVFEDIKNTILDHSPNRYKKDFDHTAKGYDPKWNTHTLDVTVKGRVQTKSQLKSVWIDWMKHKKGLPK
jgi:hypothetical protein